MNKELMMFKRLKYSGDGQEFIDYLQSLSRMNYEAFKKNPAEMNDINKGYAIAIDNLLLCFEQCEIEPLNEGENEPPEWA